MMSLSVLLPGAMFLLGASVPGIMFLQGEGSVYRWSLPSGVILGDWETPPRTRKVGGMHPT